MTISITGVPGSGKSTIATMLSEHYKIPWYSIGAIRGKMALDRGMTLEEFNALGETESFTDTEVDEYQKNLGVSGNSFIAEGRTSWYFIPHSIKIFLDADPDVAAKRIFNASGVGREDEKSYASADELQRALTERTESDRRRYQKYYGIDYLDRSNYDLVVDTTRLTRQEVFKQVRDFVDAQQATT